MWYKLVGFIDWFGTYTQRYKLVKNFNASAKASFLMGEAPTLLQAKITKGGEIGYKHSFSKWLSGGFRIKVLSGHPLPKGDLVNMAQIVLANTELVRNMVTNGFDTLEIHDIKGVVGVKFPLKKYANIGGFLE